jgi:hypothetical protein
MSFVQRCNSLKEAAKLSLDEIEGFDLISERVLTQVVLESIRLYQQKVAVGIEDSASDLLDTFKKNITNQIIERSSGWRIAQRDYFLLPKGCRFCFQKGNNKIVVIECEPQVRTLSFSAGMQNYHDQYAGESSERATLSLPYIVFVFVFTNDKFLNVRSFWRTAPLKNLNDDLHCCVLPNTHIGGVLCLGKDVLLYSSIRHDSTISEVCETIIGSYWSSQFNTDLSVEWWSKQTISNKIATGILWQENTVRDPLFIFGVPFRLYKTLREVIDSTSVVEELTESVFRQSVCSDVDRCVEKLFHKITAYLKKTKFEKHSPKDIEESLKTHMKNSVTELIEVVASLHHEINKLSSEIKMPDNKPMSQVGILWSHYT